MTRAFYLLLGVVAVAAFSGCDILGTSKVDNPVFGPPPPRTGMADPPESSRFSSSLSDTDDGGRVRVVDFDSTPDKLAGKAELSGTQVVAIVNGTPIFASEVLEDQGPMLKKARAQLPPEEFEKGRMHVIRQLLKEHIQRRLLAEALRESLDKDQMERLDQAINSMYEQQVERLKKQFKVNTEHEVDLELQKQNDTTLARLKHNFAVQAMAGAYREGKADPKVSFGRPELYKYYEEHITDYDYPTRVRWQQISVSFEKHGGRDEALKRLELAVNKLKANEDFGAVAQEFSDGANAKKGGDFGWSQPESIADDKVRQALTDLEPGTISRVIESGNSFRLVLVNDRKEAGRLPFDKVQGKIQKKLEEEARKEAEQKLLDKLYAEAIVETIFDEPKSTPKPETQPIRANVNKPSANAAGVRGLPTNRGKNSKKSS